MDELAGTENRVAVERQRYNDACSRLTNISKVKRFQDLLLQRKLVLKRRPYFKACRKVPELLRRVNFEN